MELRHLRYFRAVAELLNFSRAAEKLHVAQPALSRQIRALEEEIGSRLFEREGGTRLTNAGRVFHAHVCKVLAQVEAAVAAVHGADAAGTGELIVCNDWRLAGELIPATIAEFRARFPRAEVTLQDLRFHDQITALRGHRAHLGFVVRTLLGRADDLSTQLVLRSRLMVVLPARHPLAPKKNLRLAELADELWLTLDEKEAPGYRAFVTQLCRLSGFSPRFGKSASTMDGLFGRVAAGYGVALTLDSIAPQKHPLMRVLSIDTEPVELCAVWHRSEKSPLLHAFLEILRGRIASRTNPMVKALRRT